MAALLFRADDGTEYELDRLAGERSRVRREHPEAQFFTAPFDRDRAVCVAFLKLALAMFEEEVTS